MEEKAGGPILPHCSRELIHRICGVVDVNALEINLDGELSAIYPTAYLLEHDCVPNTVYVFAGEQESYRQG